VTTEITKLADAAGIRGWVLYDGDCPFCCGWARRFEKVLTRRGFDLAPVQAPWVGECLGLRVEAPLREMRVVTLEGRCFGGADAVLFLARTIWWGWPLVVFGLLPGAKPLLRAGYRWLAAKRKCFGGSCHTNGAGQGRAMLRAENL
jgi:predicted DCC family thiol-disulfide oxidoreductase YuxK